MYGLVCLIASALFLLVGLLSVKNSKAAFYRTHITEPPAAVARDDGRHVCYTLARATARDGAPQCTSPPSDQGWCSSDGRLYYSMVSFCFDPVLNVTSRTNFTRAFHRSCGHSFDCVASFGAPTITYELGREADFRIGRARYALKPEEIAAFALGGILGAAAIAIWIVWLLRNAIEHGVDSIAGSGLIMCAIGIGCLAPGIHMAPPASHDEYDNVFLLLISAPCFRRSVVLW